jgi:hypothetical protein
VQDLQPKRQLLARFLPKDGDAEVDKSAKENVVPPLVRAHDKFVCAQTLCQCDHAGQRAREWASVTRAAATSRQRVYTHRGAVDLTVVQKVVEQAMKQDPFFCIAALYHLIPLQADGEAAASAAYPPEFVRRRLILFVGLVAGYVCVHVCVRVCVCV